MSFHYLLIADQSILQKLLMKRLTDTDLTAGQPKILDYLIDHDGAIQAEIAAACHVEPASLTSALNGMEAKGLVQRRRRDGNRRNYYIHLTEKGRRMSLRVAQAFDELESELFSPLSSEQKKQFKDTFEQLHLRLQAMLEASGKEEA